MLKRTHLSIALLTITTLGLLVAGYRHQEQARARVAHSVQVLTEIQAARASLVISRNQYDIYLEGAAVADYRHSLAVLAGSVDRLQLLTVDNAKQQKHLREWRSLVAFDATNPKRQIFTDYQRRLFVEIGQDEINLLQARQASSDRTLLVLDGLTLFCFTVAAIATMQALRSQEALTKRTAQLEAIMKEMPAAVLVRRGSDGVCTEVLSQGDRLLLADEMLGKSPHQVTTKENATAIMSAIGQALQQQQTVELEFQATLPDGRKPWFDMSVSPLPHSDSVLIMSRDITEDYEDRSLLLRQVMLDGMTGLYAKTYFETRLVQAINAASRPLAKDQLFVLIIIDIDNLKQLNDNHSHETGDDAIKKVAKVLSESVRQKDLCGRLGGDEFAMLLYTSKEIAIERAEEIRDRVSQIKAVHLDQAIVPVSVSIGVAAYPMDGNTPKALKYAADKALLNGKKVAKNSVYVAA